MTPVLNTHLNMTENSSSASNNVILLMESLAQVAVLPEIWTYNPPLWFSHAESYFFNSHVADSCTKYDLVILKLQFEILSLVRNFVLNLAGLSFTPYEDLKAISPYRLKICNSVFQGYVQ